MNDAATTLPGSAPATILIQLSDLHLRAGEAGAEPARRLEHAIGELMTLRPRPTAVLLSGDLADDGSSAAYAQAHQLLVGLGVALHAIPGNHDDRALLRARFGPQSALATAPVRFAAHCGALRLVGCDSTLPGAEGGGLDTEQLEWLDRTLAEEPSTATLLALHHPPLRTGVRAMDEISLDASDSRMLEELLGGHPQVRSVTCGHAHTTMVSAFAGRPLLVCPSTNSALALDLRPDEGIAFATAPRPLGFAIHTLAGGRLVSHIQPL